ncbi:syntaxin-43-like isoform X2 [Amaranthus tricolor]|uniref:syntaxin-43-like isoform X2 n=1 Tax=Amaranthus tricolor TaxID=29722 RepID=UPI00258B9D9F|nr:syntaxin-43-like isoform X2 [Amaranthus tricolor]
MATRNRTALFRKHRDAIKAVRTPDLSLMPGGSGGRAGGPVIEMTSLLNSNASSSSYAPLSTDEPSTSRDALTVGLPPAWVDIAEEITSNIQRARIKMAELVKAHSKALMPSFGDARDDQHQIEGLTLEITGILRRSEKRLKDLSARGPSEDSGVRKNVQRSLATDLQNLSVEFRKKQSTYLKRLRQQKEGADDIDIEMNINGSVPKFEDEFSDVGFDNHQMAEFKKSERLTAEREREINQVVQSVNELAQIMKDLSVLVIDQGTIVDRIDFNIQNVAASVEEGFKQLQKAERSQRQGGMVRCATILIIMCFVMLVLLVLKEILF